MGYLVGIVVFLVLVFEGLSYIIEDVYTRRRRH